jgi:hypothetical protein
LACELSAEYFVDLVFTVGLCELRVESSALTSSSIAFTSEIFELELKSFHLLYVFSACTTILETSHLLLQS